MRPRTLVFLGLAVLTTVRLLLIGQLELFPDEAYYHLWSERPDIAYYSKGPGVATAIRIGTSLFGHNAFGVRCLSPLLGLGTSLILFFLTRRLFNERIAIWTVLAASVIPIWNVGSLLMTIDPLSIFFWTAALATFWLALEKSPSFSAYWPATGLLMALGFLCKYTNAFQLVSIILLLAFTAKYRREFTRPGFYSMLVTFALGAIPPIVWNARHEWITIAHLRARGGLDRAATIRVGDLFEFASAHLLVYSPLVFVGAMLALFWGCRQASRSFKDRFLVAFALPLLIFYFALSLSQAGEANWTAPAFASLLILTVALWHEFAERSAVARIFVVSALAVAAAMTLFALNTDLLRLAGIRWPYSTDPGGRMRGWKTATEEVQKIRDRFEQQHGGRVFMIANKYQTAAALAFYLPEKRVEGPGHPPVYIPESQFIENQFSFWPRYDEFMAVSATDLPKEAYYTEEQGINPFMGRTALYVTDQPDRTPASSVKNGFRRVEMLDLFEVRRRGFPVRTIRVFACYDYQTLPL